LASITRDSTPKTCRWKKAATSKSRSGVTRPYAKRVADHAKREGLSQSEAERRVVSVDRERQGFIRRHYERDASEPNHYDIVVNTECMTPDRAADVLVAAYGAKFGRLPKGAG